MNDVIADPSQVTVGWLTDVLKKDGSLVQGTVISFESRIQRRELSSNIRLSITYSPDARGELPRALFLKLVTLDLEDEFFGPSEVNYYVRDYVGLSQAPIPHTYHAAYSDLLGCYHILMDDFSNTHVTAYHKTPTLEYGLALAEALAILHAHWWGQTRLDASDSLIPDSDGIEAFIQFSRSGAENILNDRQSIDQFEDHWPDAIRSIFKYHPQRMLQRTGDVSGFTLIHGDVNHHNILVPTEGVIPLYIIDRQPFNWSLTTWLGVYDLSYAIGMDWDIDLRRQHEQQILHHYFDHLAQHGVDDYTWEQCFTDYHLSMIMNVYVATEWCRSEINEPTRHFWMTMLQRAMTAFDDLNCMELL